MFILEMLLRNSNLHTCTTIVIESCDWTQKQLPEMSTWCWHLYMQESKLRRKDAAERWAPQHNSPLHSWQLGYKTHCNSARAPLYRLEGFYYSNIVSSLFSWPPEIDDTHKKYLMLNASDFPRNMLTVHKVCRAKYLEHSPHNSTSLSSYAQGMNKQKLSTHMLWVNRDFSLRIL